MDTVSLYIRPYFRTRLVAAVLSLAGFWICLARVDRPRTGPAVVAVEMRGREEPPRITDKPLPSGLETTEEATPQTPPEVPLPVIMIDPGHGGSDGGMVRNGLLEKDWTLKVGVALAAELKERGHRVELTRDSDATIPLEERPMLINAAPRLALLSIHFNAGTPEAGGVETWYSWPKKPEVMARLHDAGGIPLSGVLPDDGQQLAQCVQAAVTGRTGARDRGIKNRVDLAMTSRTLCPAVLIECGFLSNGSESRKIQDAAYRNKLVKGIADGFEAWQKARQGEEGLPLVPLGLAEAVPVSVPPGRERDEEH